MSCGADALDPRDRSHEFVSDAGVVKGGRAEVDSPPSTLGQFLLGSRVILADLALPEVLQRIVVAGRELTRAGYGVLTVNVPDPLLHNGIHDAMVVRTGQPADGDSVTGAAPEDHRSVSRFLSVPIRIRDEPYGNLFLGKPEAGGFTAADAEMMDGLAVTAAIAIDNAHLYAEAKHRQEWLHAAAEVTRQLLTNKGDEPLRLIARQAQRLAGADAATVVLQTVDLQSLTVVVASGEVTAGLESRTFPMRDTFAGQAIDTAQPILIDEDPRGGGDQPLILEMLPVGPMMLLPLRGSNGVRGALTLFRMRGGPRFTESDLEMAGIFANHASVAVELADARDAQQRVLVLRDRDLLARDLHDQVIQRLFAAGLTVQSVSAGLHDGEAQERLTGVVTEFDDAIRQIRTSIFALRGLRRPATTTVRARLLAVIAEARPLLGFEPEVHFAGPVDTAVPESVVDDLVAVLREALTNTARHAHATAVRIQVIATEAQLDLHVIDDGVGIGSTRRRSGLANLSQRAALHGGELVVAPAPPGWAGSGHTGTKVRFTIPL